MQVYVNTQTDENSLNCKQGVLPGIQESKYQPIRGEVDERREGARWGSCFPSFVSAPAE